MTRGRPSANSRVVALLKKFERNKKISKGEFQELAELWAKIKKRNNAVQKKKLFDLIRITNFWKKKHNIKQYQQE